MLVLKRSLKNEKKINDFWNEQILKKSEKVQATSRAPVVAIRLVTEYGKLRNKLELA